MRSLYLKITAALLMVFFVVGVVHYADAAFPGKQQSKEVVVKSDNTTDLVQQNATRPMDDDMMILLIILCFVLPPLAVYLKYDEAGKPFIVNVILTLLCGLPGVIHALYHVLK
jgi:uncharacterized membrane protein YqaE (UPF0057 family)